MPRQILIIGLGNDYRGDDAVGRAVARRLQAIAGDYVRVLEESGEGVALMESWKGGDFVILIDAVHSSAAAGTIHRFDAATQPVPGSFFHYSTHAFSVAEAVELARALNQLPPQLVIYGIEGKNFDSRVGLSPEVKMAAEELFRMVKEDLCTNSRSYDLLRKIESIAREQGGQRVAGLKVKLGVLSHISADHFASTSKPLREARSAEGARLEIETLTDEYDPHAQDILLDSVELED